MTSLVFFLGNIAYKYQTPTVVAISSKTPAHHGECG